MDAHTPAIDVGPVVIELPYPPSMNRIWRSAASAAGQQVYLAPSYVKWRQAADALLMSERGWSKKRLIGPFEIEIGLCPPKSHPRGDLDNRIKAVLDWLQRANIIVNDKFCQRLVVQWVPTEAAPCGCRATLRAFP